MNYRNRIGNMPQQAPFLPPRNPATVLDDGKSALFAEYDRRSAVTMESAESRRIQHPTGMDIINLLVCCSFIRKAIK